MGCERGPCGDCPERFTCESSDLTVDVLLNSRDIFDQSMDMGPQNTIDPLASLMNGASVYEIAQASEPELKLVVKDAEPIGLCAQAMCGACPLFEQCKGSKLSMKDVLATKPDHSISTILSTEKSVVHTVKPRVPIQPASRIVLNKPREVVPPSITTPVAETTAPVTPDIVPFEQNQPVEVPVIKLDVPAVVVGGGQAVEIVAPPIVKKRESFVIPPTTIKAPREPVEAPRPVQRIHPASIESAPRQQEVHFSPAPAPEIITPAYVDPQISPQQKSSIKAPDFIPAYVAVEQPVTRTRSVTPKRIPVKIKHRDIPHVDHRAEVPPVVKTSRTAAHPIKITHHSKEIPHRKPRSVIQQRDDPHSEAPTHVADHIATMKPRVIHKNPVTQIHRVSPPPPDVAAADTTLSVDQESLLPLINPINSHRDIPPVAMSPEIFASQTESEEAVATVTSQEKVVFQHEAQAETTFAENTATITIDSHESFSMIEEPAEEPAEEPMLTTELQNSHSVDPSSISELSTEEMEVEEALPLKTEPVIESSSIDESSLFDREPTDITDILVEAPTADNEFFEAPQQSTIDQVVFTEAPIANEIPVENNPIEVTSQVTEPAPEQELSTQEHVLQQDSVTVSPSEFANDEPIELNLCETQFTSEGTVFVLEKEEFQEVEIQEVIDMTLETSLVQSVTVFTRTENPILQTVSEDIQQEVPSDLHESIATQLSLNRVPEQEAAPDKSESEAPEESSLIQYLLFFALEELIFLLETYTEEKPSEENLPEEEIISVFRNWKEKRLLGNHTKGVSFSNPNTKIIVTFYLILVQYLSMEKTLETSSERSNPSYNLLTLL